jgi:hypothetical protein
MDDEKLMAERAKDGLKVVYQSSSTGIMIYHFADTAGKDKFLKRAATHNIKIIEGGK